MEKGCEPCLCAAWGENIQRKSFGLTVFTGLLLFLAIFLEYLGTAIFAFLILALSLPFLYLILSPRSQIAELLLALTIPLLAISSILYIGNPSMLIFPLSALISTLLGIFIHNQVAQPQPYTAIRLKIHHFLLVISGALLISLLYFPFLAILPSITTTVFDVLTALIAVSISLLLLGWFLVRAEEKG